MQIYMANSRDITRGSKNSTKKHNQYVGKREKIESCKCLIKAINDRESMDDKNGDKEQGQQIQNGNKYGRY